MRKIVLLAASMVATLAMCVGVSAADSVPSDVNLNNFKLSWSDEFSGTSLNDAYWTPQIGNGIEYGNRGWGNNEKEYYKAENVSVSNGTMKIKAQTEKTTANGTTYNWTSAGITGTGKVNIGLGYVEAKIKIPSSQGIWPAFWMLGTNGKKWPACGEIDIMEYIDCWSSKEYQINVHVTDKKNGNRIKKMNPQLVKADVSKFHIYTLEWYKDKLVFLLDGNLCYQFDKKEGEAWPFDKPYSLILNVAYGGWGGSCGMDDSAFPCEMKVDWIRYYKLKE